MLKEEDSKKDFTNPCRHQKPILEKLISLIKNPYHSGIDADTAQWLWSFFLQQKKFHKGLSLAGVSVSGLLTPSPTVNKSNSIVSEIEFLLNSNKEYLNGCAELKDLWESLERFVQYRKAIK